MMSNVDNSALCNIRVMRAVASEFQTDINPHDPQCSVGLLKPPSTRKLLFLEGLRGLAALYVVLHHVYCQIVYSHEHLSPAVAMLAQTLSYGSVSVSVFIVLSGYCLMLPMARRRSLYLRGGLVDFFQRRAKRILPAYYAAIAATIALALYLPAFSVCKGIWASSIPVIDGPVIISHLFLIHNLRSEWCHTLNYPMWSIATEWQIYFVFALLLLPVARRFGGFVAVCLAFILSFAPHFMMKGYLDWAVPWYIFLFALGSTCAWISQNHKERLTLKMCSLATLCFLGLLIASYLASKLFRFDGIIYLDTLVGFSFASFLLLLNCDHHFSRTTVSVLSTKPLVLLGSISYSLYLIHSLIIVLVDSVTSNLSSQPDLHLAVLLLFVVPLALLAAAIFSNIFEKPFMQSSALPK